MIRLARQAVVAESVRPQVKIDARGPARFRAGADGLYRTTVEIDGVDVDMLINTGASHSILSEHDAKRVFGTAAEDYAGQVQTMDSPLPLRLRTARSVVIAGHTLDDVEVGLVPGVPISVVGNNWLEALGLITFQPHLTART